MKEYISNNAKVDSVFAHQLLRGSFIMHKQPNHPKHHANDSALLSEAIPADCIVRVLATLNALSGRRVALVLDKTHAHVLVETLTRSSTHITAFVYADCRGIYQAAPPFVPYKNHPIQSHTLQMERPSLCGRPIVNPDEVFLTGATDVMLCLWPSDDRIWANRAVFLRQSLSVHRVFDMNMHRASRSQAA